MKLENRLFTPKEIQESISNGHLYIQRNSYRRILINEKWKNLDERYWEEFNAFNEEGEVLWVGPTFRVTKGITYVYWAVWHGSNERRRSDVISKGTGQSCPYYSEKSLKDAGVEGTLLELILQFDRQFAIGRQQLRSMRNAEKGIRKEYEEDVEMLTANGYSDEEIHSFVEDFVDVEKVRTLQSTGIIEPGSINDI